MCGLADSRCQFSAKSIGTCVRRFALPPSTREAKKFALLGRSRVVVRKAVLANPLHATVDRPASIECCRGTNRPQTLKILVVVERKDKPI